MRTLAAVYSKATRYFGVSEKLSSDFGLIILANAINNLTTFTANIAIARYLGQEVFGLFSVAVTVAMTTLTVSEFGMNITMVRLYGLHREDKERSKAVLVCNLCFKIMVLAFLAAVAVALGDIISMYLTKSSEYAWLVGLAILSGGILSFWTYIKALLQALDRFKQIARLTMVYAILRVVLLSAFGLSQTLHTPEALILSVYLLPIAAVCARAYPTLKAAIALPCTPFSTVIDTLWESLSYSKWVAGSGITFLFLQQSMTFITAAFGDLRQVALLNAGLVFTAVFALLNDAVQQMILPKVSAMSIDGLLSYKRKIMKFLPPFVVLSLLAITLLSVLMSVLLGDRYSESLPIFLVTSLGAAATTAIGFHSILVHSIRLPSISLYINLFTLLAFVPLGSILMVKAGLFYMTIWHAISVVIGEAIKVIIINRYARSLQGSNKCLSETKSHE